MRPHLIAVEVVDYQVLPQHVPLLPHQRREQLLVLLVAGVGPVG